MPPKRGDFHCSVCGFRCRYDYFGKEPPFEHASIRWLEDIYALKNPSPEEYGEVGVGENILSNKDGEVMRHPTQVFYQVRFCKSCVQQAKNHFPPDVAEGLAKDLRKLLDEKSTKSTLKRFVFS